jgi:hypothetical protein
MNGTKKVYVLNANRAGIAVQVLQERFGLMMLREGLWQNSVGVP